MENVSAKQRNKQKNKTKLKPISKLCWHKSEKKVKKKKKNKETDDIQKNRSLG